MDDPDGKPAQDQATQQQILQFMTTEHFTLQTAKSATVAEERSPRLRSGSIS